MFRFTVTLELWISEDDERLDYGGALQYIKHLYTVLCAVRPWTATRIGETCNYKETPDPITQPTLLTSLPRQQTVDAFKPQEVLAEFVRLKKAGQKRSCEEFQYWIANSCARHVHGHANPIAFRACGLETKGLLFVGDWI